MKSKFFLRLSFTPLPSVISLQGVINVKYSEWIKQIEEFKHLYFYALNIYHFSDILSKLSAIFLNILSFLNKVSIKITLHTDFIENAPS